MFRPLEIEPVQLWKSIYQRQLLLRWSLSRDQASKVIVQRSKSDVVMGSYLMSIENLTATPLLAYLDVKAHHETLW